MAFVPTEEQRKTVETMVAFGIPEESIAACLDISVGMISTHFAKEKLTAQAVANAAVARSLFEAATKGGNVAAMQFWLKTRAGWREPAQAFEHELNHNYASLSEKELQDELDKIGARRGIANAARNVAPGMPGGPAKLVH